jgi:hypothetical protein
MYSKFTLKVKTQIKQLTILNIFLINLYYILNKNSYYDISINVSISSLFSTFQNKIFHKQIKLSQIHSLKL